MCPSRAHPIAFFKSLHDMNLKTGSAPLVRMTLMPRPPISQKVLKSNGRQGRAAQLRSGGGPRDHERPQVFQLSS
eukprot:2129531-Pyramimonas_sp.AAC.1